jgi:4-amino-4-deoxy-L-arabinose transferase-like glycosyltransferase
VKPVENSYDQTNWLKPVVTALVAVAVLASIYAHVRVAGSDTYVGVLAALDRVFDLAFAAGITVLLTALGLAVARLFNFDWSNTAETISISLFLGTGVFGLAVLGLGLLGLLTPVPFLIITFLTLAFSRREIHKLYHLIREALTTTLSTTDGKILTGLLVGFAILLLLRAATPPHVFDEAIYHLPVTHQFVDQGRIVPEFNNSLGNQPFLVHMIYAVCLMANSDIAAKLFNLALAVATSFALYGFCKRFVSSRVGVIAAIAFFAAGMVTEVAVTTRVDVSLAGIIFVTTYSMINYLDTRKRGWLWISALLAGFSLGVKHSAALWLPLIGAMYLIESLWNSREGFAATVKYGVAYAAIALAVASPWYVKNYVWFGNPVYPFFTGEVAAYGASGLRYFDGEAERKLDEYFDVVRKEDPELVKAGEETFAANAAARPERHPMRPWEVYLKPDTYLMAEARHYPNYLFLVLPLSFLITRRRWLVWLLVLSTCYFLIATQSTWIARHLLPAYPAWTIITAFTLVTVGDWLKKRAAFARNLPIYLTALALGVVVSSSVRSLRETNALSFIAGSTSRRDFMRGFTWYRPLEFINTELPADARIMMIGAQMTYGLRREYLSDELWYTTKWRRLLVHNSSLQEVHEDLKSQGVNYVLFSPGLFLFAAANGLENGIVVPESPRPLAAKIFAIDMKSANEVKSGFEEAQKLGSDFPVLRNWATFSVYQKKFLEPVYSDEDGYRIYRLR